MNYGQDIEFKASPYLGFFAKVRACNLHERKLVLRTISGYFIHYSESENSINFTKGNIERYKVEFIANGFTQRMSIDSNETLIQF